MVKSSFYFILLLLIFNLVIVAGEPYANEDCSDAEIQKSWESVFRESYGDAVINKIQSEHNDCKYIVSKSKLNESYILIGSNLISNKEKTSNMKFIYVNGSVESGVLVEGVSENNLIEFASERKINNINEAELEFNRFFKSIRLEDWVLVGGGSDLGYYRSEKLDTENKKTFVKSVFENKKMNMFYYKFIVENVSILAFNKDIGDFFVEKGEEVKFNVKVYLVNPEELEGLKYRVSGAENVSIIFKGDVMIIKWDKNFEGIEKVRLYVSDKSGKNEIRSNSFFIIGKEESVLPSEEKYVPVSNKNISETKPGKEEKLSWFVENKKVLLISVVLVSCFFVLIIIFLIVYFLFLKKEKGEKISDSVGVNEYIKKLKLD